jgi:16S rRNA (adenine1518-N6/adenine1519-N6)-dimethyltransferase
MYTLKKSLGQHFLKDEDICRKIVDSLSAIPFTQLLEVGPGGGALTRYLLKLPGIDLKAVELDEEKLVFLKNTYPALEHRLIHQSILDMDPPFDTPFMVVGNFPYNISTQIVFRILEWEDRVQGVVGMFQKEVAQRIAAKEGSKVYGVTSVLVQAWYSVDYLFDVAESSFIPPPKVMSGVIRMTPLPQPVAMKSRSAFFNLVKTAFGQRRKTLRNACRGLFEPAALERPIFDLRAEQLTVQQFAQLSFDMK